MFPLVFPVPSFVLEGGSGSLFSSLTFLSSPWPTCHRFFGFTLRRAYGLKATAPEGLLAAVLFLFLALSKPTSAMRFILFALSLTSTQLFDLFMFRSRRDFTFFKIIFSCSFLVSKFASASLTSSFASLISALPLASSNRALASCKAPRAAWIAFAARVCSKPRLVVDGPFIFFSFNFFSMSSVVYVKLSTRVSLFRRSFIASNFPSSSSCLRAVFIAVSYWFTSACVTLLSETNLNGKTFLVPANSSFSILSVAIGFVFFVLGSEYGCFDLSIANAT
mmetsp:Transcript_19391/g.40829  ORF Transcript_19391/g.40829 Transcript_19391/m.40829 type:complete len:278 (-) Transcript_19391:3-836(-)